MKSLRSLIASAALLLTPFLAQGAITITITQVDGDVIATGAGTVNLTDLTPGSSSNSPAGVRADIGFIGLGAPGSQAVGSYSGLNGPTTFGLSSFFYFPNSGSGDRLSITSNTSTLRVPTGYTSGTPLSFTSTWTEQTLSGLGLTPGEYVWTWGSGATADSITMNAVVPEPSTYAAIAGVLALGIVFWRRRRS